MVHQLKKIYFADLSEFTYFVLELQADSWSSDLIIKLQLDILSTEQIDSNRETDWERFNQT